MRVLVLAIALSLSSPVLAQQTIRIDASDLAPSASVRPDPRPGTATDPQVSVTAEAPAPTRPRPLAGLFRPRGELRATVITSAGSTLAVTRSLRPSLRPDGLADRVRATATRNTPGRVTQPGANTGTLCGVVGLQGEVIDPVPGRIAGCGIPSAVRLRVVHGITLTTPATINCGTAQAVSQWVLAANDIIGDTGGGMTNLRVVASYSCRTRNNRPGARLSEHSTGNAIDIAGIGLASGEELSVLNDWRSNRSQIMRDLHRAACGPFGTVLGPDADRAHQDHFHFDIASYRSGPYCR